jgi:hypothetical protein
MCTAMLLLLICIAMQVVVVAVRVKKAVGSRRMATVVETPLIIRKAMEMFKDLVKQGRHRQEYS